MVDENPEISADFSRTVFGNLLKNHTEEDSHNQWTNLKTSIISAANKLIQESEKIKHPQRVTDEIKNLLHKRRGSKSNPEKKAGYKKKSKSNVNMLKSGGWKKCQIEKWDDTNIKEMFKKIREIAKKGPLPIIRSVRSLNGQIMCEPDIKNFGRNTLLLYFMMIEKKLMTIKQSHTNLAFQY